MIVTRSPRLFLEREGLVETRRGPLMRVAPRRSAMEAFPVAIPLPEPSALVGQPGAPPDGGLTATWPHPDSDQPR